MGSGLVIWAMTVNLMMTFRNVITLLLISSAGIICCLDRNSGGSPDTSDSLQDSIPPVPDTIISGMRKYHNTRSAYFSGWLPDGKGMVIQTRFAETNQIHIVYTPGGARYQKTFRSEEIFGVAVCPDPSKIKAPLLIIQGANDPRVPASESEQIAAAVKKNGKPVWMFVAPDEGHGFRKKSNKEYQDYVTAMFLERFITGDTP